MGDIHFRSVYGVNVTRISRPGMDLFAGRNHRFIVGDRIMVGPLRTLIRVASMMGNSEKRLNAPNIATLSLVPSVVSSSGTFPIAIPHMLPFQ